MRNVVNLIKNNLIRILNKKEIIIIAMVVVPLMIGIAVLFSGKLHIKEHIALVTSGSQRIPQSKGIQIDVMKEKPGESTLLLGKYAAIVEEKKDGSYEVTTVKSDAQKESIERLFRDGKLSRTTSGKTGKRGTGTNILGFILMIVLMQGIALMLLYPEDRTVKTFKRVLTAPVSEKAYLLAQGLFTFACLFLPTYLAVAVTKMCFGLDIGFSLGMLAVMIGILSLFSTSLAVFLSSVLERNVSLVACGIYIITSILAGSFYSFTGDNKVLDAVCSIIPQKAYMSMSQGIENGRGMWVFKGQLLYLFVWIAALWLLGCLVTRRKIRKGI